MANHDRPGAEPRASAHTDVSATVPRSMMKRRPGKTPPLLVGLVLASLQLLSSCHETSTASTSTSTSTSTSKSTTPSSTMGALESGVNLQGRDLSEFGVRSEDAASCADLCAAEPRCKAMSYMSRPAPDQGICWLKGSVPEPSSNAATVSAVKIAPP